MLPNLDEDYVKPSEHKQWHERYTRDVHPRTITREEIDLLRTGLVRSYGCKPEEITYAFSKINNTEDEDRYDCVYLKYYLKIDGGVGREIFTYKVALPEELRRRAEQYDRDRTRARREIRRPNGDLTHHQ